MKTSYDALVIGAGPAGLSAAASLANSGISDVLVVEREENPGGVLFQCIHSGFGIHRFGSQLTGPEYAERDIAIAHDKNISILTNTAVIDLQRNAQGIQAVLASRDKGIVAVQARAVILAMGCRERTRGTINIPGERPAGIMTAGLAQRLVNLEGYLPGKEIVIQGSGDIGLIMARRLSLEGVYVRGVVEIQPFPGGLTRNIVSCLNDFHIPLYLSHTISKIFGKKRIEAVEIAPVMPDMAPDSKDRFVLSCDTLLLSVGLVPENELSIRAGVIMDPASHGPSVDSSLATSVPGIFACGNVLHVHDLADFVSEEATRAGEMAGRWLGGEMPSKPGMAVKAGNLVRYVLPRTVYPGCPALFSLRPIAPAEDVVLRIRSGDKTLFSKKFQKVIPSNMIQCPVPVVPDSGSPVEVSFSEEIS